MRLTLRRLTAATAIALALGTPAHAQDAPPGLFSPDVIIGGLFRMGITYLRGIADVTYADLTVDTARGTISLRQLEVQPLYELRNCRISVDHVMASGPLILPAEADQQRLDIRGLRIANGCFGPEGAMLTIFTNANEIIIDELSIDSYYQSANGASELDISVLSNDLGRIEANARFDTVSMTAWPFLDAISPDQHYDNPFGPPPGADRDQWRKEQSTDRGGVTRRPAARSAFPYRSFDLRGELRSAHISFENRGIWDRVGPLVMDGLFADGDIRGTVMGAGISTDDPAYPFAESLVTAIESFVESPGRLTIETRLDAPLRFDTAEWLGAEDAFRQIPFVATNTLPRPVTLLSDPDADGPLLAGLAYARGEGVPQNRARAIELLTPLADGGDAEFALILAGVLLPDDPAGAYRHAQMAAAAGSSLAAITLDRAEARLNTGDILAAQAAAGPAPRDEDFGSLVALRAAAAGYEEGNGRARSYVQAWRMASLASAAGDRASRSLMLRLDTRLGSDPAWLAARDEAEALAASDWQARRLDQVLSGEAP